MEELKSQYEGEIQSLKNRYRKEKTSSDSAISDQLNQLEQELNEQWRVKSERMVQQTEERWKRKNQDLEVEKQIMSAISAMHSEVSSLTHSFPPFIS